MKPGTANRIRGIYHHLRMKRCGSRVVPVQSGQGILRSPHLDGPARVVHRLFPSEPERLPDRDILRVLIPCDKQHYQRVFPETWVAASFLCRYVCAALWRCILLWSLSPGLFGVGCRENSLLRRDKSDVLDYGAFGLVAVLRDQVTRLIQPTPHLYVLRTFGVQAILLSAQGFWHNHCKQTSDKASTRIFARGS